MKVRALLLALAFLAQNLGGEPPLKPEIDANARADLVRRVQETISKYYVYPDKGAAIAQELRKREQAGSYNEVTDPNQLADRLTRDAREVCNDRHIRIEHNPQLERDVLEFTSGKAGAAKVRAEEIEKEKKQNFFFNQAEVLRGNIGYIEFTQFAKTSPGAKAAIRAAMQFVSNADALIIDLRNNHGGDAATAGATLGYFFGSKTKLGRSFSRLEGNSSDQYVENDAGFTGGLVLKMPVYVLTSSRTFSAAEWFAYSLQTSRDAVVVGQPSSGSAHLTRSFSVGHGFVAFVPHTRFENAKTGTDWEGKGVVPNIVADEKDCLAVAQINILEQKLKGTSEAAEQRKLAWVINSLKAKRSAVQIAPSEAPAYVGRFAEFEVALTDGRLTFRDTHQPNGAPLLLTAISPTFFQAGSDYQVEFVGEKGSSYPSIKVYWEDGWMEEIRRAAP